MIGRCLLQSCNFHDFHHSLLIYIWKIFTSHIVLYFQWLCRINGTGGIYVLWWMVISFITKISQNKSPSLIFVLSQMFYLYMLNGIKLRSVGSNCFSGLWELRCLTLLCILVWPPTEPGWIINITVFKFLVCHQKQS